MKTPISSKVVRGATIIVGWMCLTAQSCNDSTGPETAVQNCSVIYDPDFPVTGDVSLNRPANCPLRLTGMTTVPYAATADLPGGSVFYGSYEGLVTSWDGYDVAFVADAVWSQGNGRYFVNITGDFTAATGGFNSTNSGWDDVRNGFYLGGGDWTYGTTRIAYSFGSTYNTVSAPGDVRPFTYYTVSATSNDWQLISPLTWSWYVDGVFEGTTSVPEFTVRSGTEWTEQYIEAVATDGYGHSVSGAEMVRTLSDCPGTQIEC